MSMKAQAIPAIPEDTIRISRAAFPKGNVYMQMRDVLRGIYQDDEFESLYPPDGQPAYSPWRLALVTVMQFTENLSDRQTADAVRGRIDWKYALSLELSDAGFDHSILCEFRQRLLDSNQQQLLLDKMLERFKAEGLLRAGGKQRTDSTHIVAAVRELTRLELVGETLRAALNSLAQVVPEWLRSVVSLTWFDRYALPFEMGRLPETEAERLQQSRTIGQDGFELLTAVDNPSAPCWLREIPAVRVLRQVWIQQYYGPDAGGEWRKQTDLAPCGQLIESPYDIQAHHACKGSTRWTGYKAHLTESCDGDLPHFITDVQTTSSTTNDQEMTDPIQHRLEQKHLLPGTHLMDAGYTSAEVLISSQAREVDVIGKVTPDPSWQRREQTGYDSTHFTIDWEAQHATCPQGKLSSGWTSGQTQYGTPTVTIRFAQPDCRACHARPLCTRAKTASRTLTVADQARYEAMQAARQRQTTPAFKDQYAQRAGVEGTMSQSTGAFGLRRSRYRGLAKTHLQNVATAAAINLVRLFYWMGEQPRSKTRTSHFAKLKPV